jgi:hypothetical protein
MKAEELRYGNKILFLGELVTFQNITEFREDGIFWIKTKEYGNCQNKNFHFKPVLLTEEILLKCNIDKWINETFEIRKNLDNTFTIYAWQSGISIFICHLEFLHQLQNIYPFLTKKELTINL